MIDLVVIGIGYLLGSLSFGVLVCRYLGLTDPRTMGSANPGATNVLRQGNKKAALYTLAGDALKGALAVLLAWILSASLWGMALAGLAAFLGHLYPIFFRFQGGKGVATAAGVLLVLAPWVALAAIATWLIVAKLLRISSLAALLATVLAPLYAWLLAASTPVIVVLCIMSLFLLWRHRDNIQRLRHGQESRF